MAEARTRCVGQGTELNKDQDVERSRLEKALEIGLEETFPASDAVAVIEPAPKERNITAKTADPATHGDAPHPRRRRHGGRRLISTEVELKLAAPAAELQKLKCMLLAMPTARSDVQADLVSIYYDTPDLALNRKRLTLRVRKQGRRFVQTVNDEHHRHADRQRHS
jgi:CYTH domain